MSTLKDLIAQQEALTKQIKEVRQLERSDAISKALALITEHELTQQDLFGGTRGTQKAKAAGKVAAKYRDPETGKEWSGRGIAPKWLKGKDREQFLIAK
jgi:DNA-binding protein H-NS